MQIVVGQAQSFDCRGPVAVDENIRFREELMENILSLRGFQVQCDAALVAVDRGEVGTGATFVE